MDLSTDKEAWNAPSQDRIEQTIRGLKKNEFAILGSAEQVFIQTMSLEGGYLLEKRDGGPDHHFEAIPKDGRSRVKTKPPWWVFWEKPNSIHYFTSDEIIEAFNGYLEGDPDPTFATWNQIWI